MQENAMQPTQGTTIKQKVGIVAALALFPATTIIVFMRHKIGYRFLSPDRLFVMFVIIWLLAGIAGLQGGGGINNGAYATVYAIRHEAPLFVFAIAMLIIGFVHRARRMKALKRGENWHTYSRGVSWLSSLPVLNAVNDSVMKRYIDPAAAFIIGFVLAFILPPLGYWIMFSAFCLFVFEAWDYEQQLNRMLDMLDSIAESGVLSDIADQYAADGSKQLPLEQTAGIPTGVAPDIQAQIERRKRSRAGAAAPVQGSTASTTATIPQTSTSAIPPAIGQMNGYAAQTQQPAAPVNWQQWQTGGQPPQTWTQQ